MKNQELFDKTVGILVNAYQNDTLIYSDCKACAVGNIVAGNIGSKLIVDHETEIVKCVGGDTDVWGSVIHGFGSGIVRDKISQNALEQINKTGYSVQDIANIERAFYLGIVSSKSFISDNFTGLMYVVDCLMTIHEATTEETTQAKSLFKKELAEVG